MTKNEFVAACIERTIAPEVALENERVRKALEDQDDEAVVEALEQEF